MSKKYLTIIIISTVLIIGFVLIHYINQNIKIEKAVNECIFSANQVCAEYGVENVDIKMSLYTDEVYLLLINGELQQVNLSKIYDFVTDIEKIRFNYDDYLLIPEITLNGDDYELNFDNKKELERNHLVVFTYRTDEDKLRLENLKTKLPYIGMPEDDIAYTMLGEPDETERFGYPNMVESHRWIKYRWRDDNGELQAEATVRHWDFNREERVDGYIFDIYFWGEFADNN